MTAARPVPATRFFPVEGTQLAAHHWEGPEGAVPLVFAHATGFHGRVWDAVIARLPAHPAWALDLRGHGQTGGGPIDDWRILSQDVAAFLDQAQVSRAIGVGHSMGAHTLMQVAADHPGAFTRLVLFDPVILAPDYYAEPMAIGAENRHPAARRKRDFASAEAMIERFRDRDPYNLFNAQVFEDYCRHGLVPAASGEGMELACAPETEASIYESSRSNSGILKAATRVAVPTLVVRALHTGVFDFKSSPTWEKLASTMPQGVDLYRPDMTHFHPFQDPADAARIIAEFIARG